LTGAERSAAGFRRFLTVIRTRARARAAALEKFIATNNPARADPAKCVSRGDSMFFGIVNNIALALRDFNGSCCSAAMT
jgi:hypothetical protein